MSQWYVWLGNIMFFGAVVALYPTWRDMLLEWIEPIFVVRSDSHHRKPHQTRQTLRTASWLCGLLCAATALGDILLHPPQANAGAAVNWATGHVLMLRWQPAISAELSNKDKMLATAADTLGVSLDTLTVKETFPEHRLMIFQGVENTTSNEAPVMAHWQAAMQNPQGKLAEIADSTFPAAFNASMCGPVRKAHKGNLAPADGTVVSKADAQAAYVAACDWWTKTLMSKLPKETAAKITEYGS
jgi:hypothetical protein